MDESALLVAATGPTDRWRADDAHPDGKSRSRSARCTRGPAPSSFRTPGTPARQSCSRRWASRRSRPPASASPTCWAALARQPRRHPRELPRRSPKRPTCRSTPIWKIAARTIRRRRPKPFGVPPRPARSAARSRTRPATANNPIYDFTLAVERVQAAVEVARALPFPFTLTARAENFLYGRNDLDDTIRRLQAFEAAAPTCCTRPACTTSRPSERWCRR